MPIYYKKGNLLDAFDQGEFDVIAHQCNCFCNMGRGIAPQIKKRYPAAWKADSNTMIGDETKLGLFSCAEVGNGSMNDYRFVYNLYGQYGYGNVPRSGTEYTALRAALKRLKASIDANDTKGPIGFPKIGCGLGGGSWPIVEKMLVDIFTDREVIVYEL